MADTKTKTKKKEQHSTVRAITQSILARTGAHFKDETEPGETPNFWCDALAIRVWSDYADPAQRAEEGADFMENRRFMIDDTDGDALWHGDDVEDLKMQIARRAMKRGVRLARV